MADNAPEILTLWINTKLKQHAISDIRVSGIDAAFWMHVLGEITGMKISSFHTDLSEWLEVSSLSAFGIDDNRLRGEDAIKLCWLMIFRFEFLVPVDTVFEIEPKYKVKRSKVGFAYRWYHFDEMKRVILRWIQCRALITDKRCFITKVIDPDVGKILSVSSKLDEFCMWLKAYEAFSNDRFDEYDYITSDPMTKSQQEVHGLFRDIANELMEERLPAPEYVSFIMLDPKTRFGEQELHKRLLAQITLETRVVDFEAALRRFSKQDLPKNIHELVSRYLQFRTERLRASRSFLLRLSPVCQYYDKFVQLQQDWQRSAGDEPQTRLMKQQRILQKLKECKLAFSTPPALVENYELMNWIKKIPSLMAQMIEDCQDLIATAQRYERTELRRSQLIEWRGELQKLMNDFECMSEPLTSIGHNLVSRLPVFIVSPDPKVADFKAYERDVEKYFNFLFELLDQKQKTFEETVESSSQLLKLVPVNTGQFDVEVENMEKAKFSISRKIELLSDTLNAVQRTVNKVFQKVNEIAAKMTAIETRPANTVHEILQQLHALDATEKAVECPSEKLKQFMNGLDGFIGAIQANYRRKTLHRCRKKYLHDAIHEREEKIEFDDTVTEATNLLITLRNQTRASSEDVDSLLQQVEMQEKLVEKTFDEPDLSSLALKLVAIIRKELHHKKQLELDETRQILETEVANFKADLNAINSKILELWDLFEKSTTDEYLDFLLLQTDGIDQRLNELYISHLRDIAPDVGHEELSRELLHLEQFHQETHDLLGQLCEGIHMKRKEHGNLRIKTKLDAIAEEISRLETDYSRVEKHISLIEEEAESKVSRRAELVTLQQIQRALGDISAELEAIEIIEEFKKSKNQLINRLHCLKEVLKEQEYGIQSKEKLRPLKDWLLKALNHLKHYDDIFASCDSDVTKWQSVINSDFIEKSSEFIDATEKQLPVQQLVMKSLNSNLHDIQDLFKHLSKLIDRSKTNFSVMKRVKDHWENISNFQTDLALFLRTLLSSKLKLTPDTTTELHDDLREFYDELKMIKDLQSILESLMEIVNPGLKLVVNNRVQACDQLYSEASDLLNEVRVAVLEIRVKMQLEHELSSVEKELDIHGPNDELKSSLLELERLAMTITNVSNDVAIRISSALEKCNNITDELEIWILDQIAALNEISAVPRGYKQSSYVREQVEAIEKKLAERRDEIKTRVETSVGLARIYQQLVDTLDRKRRILTKLPQHSSGSRNNSMSDLIAGSRLPRRSEDISLDDLMSRFDSQSDVTSNMTVVQYTPDIDDPLDVAVARVLESVPINIRVKKDRNITEGGRFYTLGRGTSARVLFCRLRGTLVVVRIGGGWQSLDEFLWTHLWLEGEGEGGDNNNE